MMLRIRSFLTRLLGKLYRDTFEHRQYASPNLFIDRRDDGVKFVPRDLFALESTTSTNKLCVVSVSQPRLTARFRNRCKFEAASGMHRDSNFDRASESSGLFARSSIDLPPLRIGRIIPIKVSKPPKPGNWDIDLCSARGELLEKFPRIVADCVENFLTRVSLSLPPLFV